MSNNTSSSSSGIGFIGLLTIVFIALKLTNYIDWSWWFVLLPMLIPFYLLAIGLILWGLGIALEKLTSGKKK